MTMIAFHGKQEIKDQYLQRVEQHRKADQLVQGYGYWQDGKGCAVGCTIHGRDHKAYETELGIPEHIAHLEEAIFESLPKELARQWPERFLSVITPGADLSTVWNQFALWLLTESELLTITDENKHAISQVTDLHRRVLANDLVTEQEWRAAAWAAAWAAAEAAAEAAWAAARAAEAARAAREAWATARAAEAARAARAAAGERMSNKLIELLSNAPL